MSNILKDLQFDYIKKCIDNNENVHDGFTNWDWKAMSLNPSLPLEVIEMFIDKEWDWYALSCHNNITISFALKHRHKDWHWSVLSSHSTLTFDIVEKEKDIPWDWNELSFNPNIRWENVAYNLLRNWNWEALSKNLNVTLSTILTFSSIPWNLNMLFLNEYFLRDAFQTYMNRLNNMELYLLWMRFEKLIDLDYFWSVITRQSFISLDMVKMNPQIPWNYKNLSYNPNLTWDFILENMSWEWDWFALTYHYNLDICICLAYYTPTYPWNWWYISRHPDVDWDLIAQHLDEDLCWLSLSMNKTVDINIVKANIHLPWDFHAFSTNPNVSLDVVLRHENSWMSSYWDWSSLSKNENITFEDVKNNIHLPWDWSMLSQNPNIVKLSSLKHFDSDDWSNLNWSSISKTLVFDFDKESKQDILKNYLFGSKGKFTRKRMFMEISEPKFHGNKQKHALIPKSLLDFLASD